MNVGENENAAQAELYQSRSFSQFGEDAVLRWIFPNKRDGFYVDVGCHHPFRISNTALLHLDFNWRGINIDVDQRAIDAFNKFRPGDTNICTGVAGKAGTMEVTIFDEGAINTFSDASASHPAWASIGRVKRMVSVDTLASILSANLPEAQSIDLMNIDAEGLDNEILRSNDWAKFRPEIVLVEAETSLDDLSQSANYRLMQEQGYRLVSHTAITSFFRRA